MAEPLAPSPRPPDRDLPLEGLRGLAALAVLYTHTLLGVAHTALDPQWTPPAWLAALEFGQGAVLLFFVLSGYVIGLIYDTPFTVAGAGVYLKKRLLRLAPINTLAVVLTVAIAGHIAWPAVAAHLLYAQNDLVTDWPAFLVFAQNPNLWSLHYEAVFYLAFLAVWALRLPILPLLTTTALLAFLPLPRIATTWLAGFTFWLGGLWLARTWRTDAVSRSNWPALALLGFVTWKSQFLTQLLGRFGLEFPWGRWVEANYFDVLPACLCVVALIAGRTHAALRWLRLFCFAWPSAFLLWRLGRGTLVFDQPQVLILLAWLAALALWKWEPPRRALSFAAPLGAVSYAFYAFAAPVQLIVSHGLTGFAGSASTFSLRLLAVLVLSLGLAWCAECRLQPLLRRWFSSPSRP